MTEIRSQVGLSDCRSFGSNQHQSGRSAKVSIGITIEKSPRSHTVVSGVRKENAPALHSPEEHSSCKGRVVDNKSRPHGAVNLETTKVVLKEQKTLDCLPSRSLSRKTSFTNADKLYVNDVSVSAHKKADGLAYNHNKREDGDTYVQQGLTFATVQKPNLLDHEVRREHPGEVDKNTNNGLKMKLWEILGGVPSQKEQNMNSPKLDENKENIKVDHNRGVREDRVPRAKHYSDPIETDSDSPNQTVRRPATRSMTRKRTPNKIVRSLDDALNSGKKPISSTCSDYKHKAEENLGEHDNEKNLFLFGREENRRMLNRKAYEKSEAHIEFEKISGSTSDNNPCSKTNFKCNNGKDIFSFAEVAGNKKTSEKNVKAQSKRYNKKRNTTIDMKTINLPSGSSSKSAMQKDKNERLFLAPTTINLPSGSSSKSIPQNSNKEKVFISPAKGIQPIVTSPCVPHPIKKQSTQPNNDPNNSKSTQINRQGLSNDPNNSKSTQMNRQGLFSIPLVPKILVYETVRSSLLEKEKPSWAYLNSSPMPKFTVQHDKAACSPVTSTEDASDDLKSPTFAGNVTPSTPSRPSNEIAGSPPQRNINFTWKFHNSDIMDNDKPGSCRSEAKTDSSDDMRNIYESHGLESTFEVGNETKERLSLSPITGHDSDSFGAKELKNTGFRQSSKWVPNDDNSEKSPVKLHKRRRVHGLKDAKLSEGNETNDLYEASGECIEDSLARSVNQLALALRRIKSKIQLHSNKKSCEILAAVADKIKLQLKDVDSQLQEDMGKFIGASKAKRKCVESRFEEHQERIRLIHEKFKEEVNHHLLNCSSTLEELEAQNFEMKGIADRKKALHRKHLLQIEDTMKDQLAAAEASISAVKMDAKKKINNLRLALKEWLGEGGALG